MQWSTVALVLSGLGAALPGSRAHPAPDPTPEKVLHELREVTHPEGRRLQLKDLDYQRLVAAIPLALPVADRPHGLWHRVRRNNPEALRDSTAYDVLSTAVGVAARIAPTREDKERWFRMELNLVLRMLRDPDTQRIYRDKHNPENHLSDYVYVASLRGRDLQGVRMQLVRERLIGPEDWGLFHEFLWADAPGSVHVRDGIVFVRDDVLRAAGVPVQVGAASAEAVFERRRASIPVGAARLMNARTGFRDRDGRTYLPVEEFHRQGVFTVDVLKGAQMVELTLERPPEHPDGAHP